MSYSIAALLVVSFLFFFFDGHTIVKNRVKKSWNGFRQVNKLVGTQYKTVGKVMFVSVKMIGKMYWMNFMQWVNNTVEHRKDHSKISYVVKGQMYSFVVRPKKGPPSVLLVYDDDGNDVTDMVLPYLGPHEDWHGDIFTPEFWNKKNLVFELSNGDSKTFKEQDEILL